MPNSRQAAAAKIGEKADGRAAHRRRLAQQAGHHDAVHQGDARPHRRLRISSSARAFSNCGCGSSHTPITVASALAVAEARAGRRLALDAQRVGPGSLPARRTDQESSSRPRVKRSPEAARPSTTISQASSEPPGVDVGHGAALQPRALEHDGLLRQPVERRALAHAHGDIDGAMAAALGGAVDLLRRLGRRHGASRPGRPRSPFSGNRRRSRRPRWSAGRPAAVRPARARGTRPGRDRVDRGRPAASAPSRRAKATRLSPEARCRRGGAGRHRPPLID